MRIGSLRTFGAVGALAFFCLGIMTVDGTAGGKVKSKHAALHHALFELHDARHELRATKYDFGAHKEKALVAINDAIKHVDLALKARGDNLKPSPTKRDLQEHHKQYKHHPHLHHAVHELRHAHKHLKDAKHDFGGHREAALRDVNQAIHQIEILLKHHKV